MSKWKRKLLVYKKNKKWTKTVGKKELLCHAEGWQYNAEIYWRAGGSIADWGMWVWVVIYNPSRRLSINLSPDCTGLNSAYRLYNRLKADCDDNIFVVNLPCLQKKSRRFNTTYEYNLQRVTYISNNMSCSIMRLKMKICYVLANNNTHYCITFVIYFLFLHVISYDWLWYIKHGD